MPDDLARAASEGRLPNLDAVLSVRSSVVSDGAAAGSRAVDIRVMNGVDLRVLPDRGLDLGEAWYGGIPLAWASAVGETAPLSHPSGFEWGASFGGGLMVTCGLRNVGMPSEGHGLHGRFSHLRSSLESVQRHVANEAWVEVRARIVEAEATGACLSVERTVRTWVGRGRVEVRDVTTNLGASPEPAPLLYHFNFGYPLWSEGARIEVNSRRVVPRDEASAVAIDAWDRPPALEAAPERVIEHLFESDEEPGRAVLINEVLGIRLGLSWRRAELPRLHQWIHPAPGVYALGVEPANCSTLGRAHDRADGRLPVLEPGETRETRLEVVVDSI
jgi:hypothetical protein